MRETISYASNMKSRKKIFLLFALWMHVVSADWDQPYIRIIHEAAELGDVSTNKVIVKFEEGVLANEEFAELLIDNVDEPRFESENFKLEGKIIMTKNPLDYETGKTDTIKISILNDGIVINIEVININDNPTTVEVLSEKCEVKEIQPSIADTGCNYRITDKDGMIDVMDINTINPDENIFKFNWKSGSKPNHEDQSADVILSTIKALDFDERQTVVFDWTVKDEKYSATTKVIVNVIDMPNKPPTWQKITPTKQLIEHTTEIIEIAAIDGDLGVNDDIEYYCDVEASLIENIVCTNEGNNEGKILIKDIDRDVDNRDTVRFNVVAKEIHSPFDEAIQEIVLIITDINDNKPLISVENESVEIDENKVSHIATSIEINDIDLGDNAKYTVELFDVSGNNIEVNDVFQVVPDTGYQKSTFSLTIIDPSKLDYEDENMRVLKLKIHSDDTENTDEFETITITLINWNDESPIWKLEEYEIEIDETFGRLEEEILAVDDLYAEDRDVGDSVTYALLGSAINKILKITNSETEKPITISSINQNNQNAQLFDFEKQEEVLVQIQALDNFPGSTVPHKVVTQLTIKVNNINDETPTIRLNSQTLTIDENCEDGYVIPDFDIFASDDDGNLAELSFSIDWDKSYATKNGRSLTTEFTQYHKCLDLTPIKNDDGSWSATLKIKDVVPQNTPNYELFDTMYIFIVVKDEAQDVGVTTATVTLVINVNNVNDNKPVFDEQSLGKTRRVNDASLKDVLIVAILATDDDELNELFYSIKPKDSNEIEPLIEIDSDSGQLRTTSTMIDADFPDTIDTLVYIVTVSDGDDTHDVSTEITIIVDDVNTKKPEFAEPLPTDPIQIFEKSDIDTEVLTVKGYDADRDEENRRLVYTISGDNVTNFFKIDGKIIKVNNKALDRDFGQSEFRVKVSISDGVFNADGENEFKIILKDVNDQWPIIEETEFSVDENKKNGDILHTISATDADEPGTPNSQINFEIVNITPNSGKLPLEKFEITTDDGKTGRIKTLMDLRDCYGEYVMTIEASDLGEDPNVKQYPIKFNIKKFNFEQHEFIFPAEPSIYLRPEQVVGQQLFTYDGNKLSDIAATDHQNGKYKFKFEVTDTNDGNKYFKILDNAGNTGLLTLVGEYDNKGTYPIEIKATAIDEDEDEVEVETITINVSITFYDINQEPIYKTNTMEVQFIEGEDDVGETVETLKGVLLVDEEEITTFPFYYNLKENMFDDAIECDKYTGDLTLKKPIWLKNIEGESYVIISVSLKEDGITSPAPESLLKVNINFEDINDQDPEFLENLYHGTIMATHEINRTVAKLVAIDGDVNDKLVFSMKEGSFKPQGENIDEKNTFKVYTNIDRTADVKLQFEVKSNMNGFFTFTAVVDDGEHTDETFVQIFIISDVHLVTFMFQNELDDVIAEEKGIQIDLSENLKFECVIDSIKPAVDDNGVPDYTTTDVVAHFIDTDTNAPKEKADIQKLMDDKDIYNKIRAALLKRGLALLNIYNPTTEENAEEALLAWLIGTGVILGVLVIFLIIAFIIQTRRLTKRLNNLNTTVFKSEENINIAPPTTNRRAVVANPIYNTSEDALQKVTEYDRKSIDSGDSDLIGVENNEHFNMEL